MSELQELDGIIVPGGFGNSGVEGKIKAISYARAHNIPYFGLCYGMQLAVVEFARSVCNLTNAHTTEVNAQTPHPVIDILSSQKSLLENHKYGGTMRLGAYTSVITSGTKVFELYEKFNRWSNSTKTKAEQKIVLERHRHRYEVNPAYVDTLTQQGIVFSGYHTRNDETELMEFLELPNHPFFVATQAHPEFTSRFGYSHPLFYGFVSACNQYATKQRGTVHKLQKEKQQTL